MKHLIAILTIIILTSCNSNTQDIDKAEKEPTLITEHEWIRNKVDSVMNENNIPAISLGIVKNGKLDFVEGFGGKNRKTKAPVDEYSIYQIGSDTKKMTGIVVKNLVNEGKLDLNKPIINYLPNALTKEAYEKLQEITLLHLLHHRSGMIWTAPSIQRIDGDPMLIPYTEQDLIYDLNHITLEFEPGTEYGYSNLGYGVIGYICERVTKKPYADLIEKYVANPYGMFNTTTELTEAQMKKLVTPYRKDNNLIETQRFIMGKMTPAGGVYSNINDMSKFMIQQIKAYQTYIQEGDKSYNPLILTDLTEPGKDNSEYGFGLAKRVDNQGALYGHGGDMDGFASTYIFSPENNLGLIMLTSSGGDWHPEFENEIIYKLTDRKYVAPKTSIIDFFYELFN